MGMRGQYRLWNVEAAIANIEILKAEQSVKFPDVVNPPKLKLDSLNDYHSSAHSPKRTTKKGKGNSREANF